jgi:hypothetical protein
MEPNEKPRIVVSAWVKGQPMTYRCSLCGQLFLLPADRTPKDAAAELVAAFQDHVGEEHAQEAKD